MSDSGAVKIKIKPAGLRSDEEVTNVANIASHELERSSYRTFVDCVVHLPWSRFKSEKHKRKEVIIFILISISKRMKNSQMSLEL